LGTRLVAGDQWPVKPLSRCGAIRSPRPFRQLVQSAVPVVVSMSPSSHAEPTWLSRGMGTAAWQEWQGLAFARVRSTVRSSDGFAQRCGLAELARTGANAAHSRQAGGHWFEPSTAHLRRPRSGGVFVFQGRMDSAVLAAERAVLAAVVRLSCRADSGAGAHGEHNGQVEKLCGLANECR
jgi:hypothetical protein